MYNRYIPQSDGSYRRNRIPDIANESSQPNFQPRREAPPKQEAPPPVCDTKNTIPPCQNGHPCPQIPPQRSQPSRPKPNRTGESAPDLGIGNFLRSLLPRDFDTEDLLVILLLLLMAGDCKEDQNSALLTLALYLFL